MEKERINNEGKMRNFTRYADDSLRVWRRNEKSPKKT